MKYKIFGENLKIDKLGIRFASPNHQCCSSAGVREERERQAPSLAN
jgi:hypothetical protein